MRLELYKVDLSLPVAEQLKHQLSAEEQQFAKTIQNPTLKTQHVKVRIAVRQILATYLQQATGTLTILKNPYGKPYLANHADCQFNISHSGDVLLVAVGNASAIGIDIECAKMHRRDFSGLVKKCFALQEQQYWQQLPDAEKAPAFYRFWTRKEAFVKAVGRGVALGLQSCVIADAAPPFLLHIPPQYGQTSDWLLYDLPLAKAGFYAALAVKTRSVFALPEPVEFKIQAAN